MGDFKSRLAATLSQQNKKRKKCLNRVQNKFQFYQLGFFKMERQRRVMASKQKSGQNSKLLKRDFGKIWTKVDFKIEPLWINCTILLITAL